MTLTYAQAIVSGFIQGITELFPVSSLGHAVLVPAWIGGSWKSFTTNPHSAYLTVTVALHFASAMALFWVFRARWAGLLGAGFRSVRGERTQSATVFWRLVLATIPVAALGFLFEKSLRNLFSKPLAASAFLLLNGLILLVAEKSSRKLPNEETQTQEDSAIAEAVKPISALAIGFGQSLALLAGISRFGITMSAGLIRGLSHKTASDFAFLLAFPVILGASIVKLPELFSKENSPLLAPILVGSLISFVLTYASVKFLVRWFKTRTLYPFAIYCFILGAVSLIRFA